MTTDSQPQPQSAPPQPPPPVWTVLLTLLGTQVAANLWVAAMLVPWCIYAAGSGAPGVPPDARVRAVIAQAMASPWWLFLSLGVTSGFSGGAALVAGRLAPEGMRRRLRLGPAGLTWPSAACAVAGLVVLGEAGTALVTWAHLPLGGSAAQVPRVLAGQPWSTLLAAVVMVGLLPGVAEELFFRGFLQTRLRERWGRWPAVLVTAGLFGLVHLNPVHVALAFTMGLYAGWLVERTGSVRLAMAGHVANNALCVLMIPLGQEGLAGRLGAGRYLVALLAVLAACVAVVARGRTGAGPAAEGAALQGDAA